jgi:hypothetical protein
MSKSKNQLSSPGRGVRIATGLLGVALAAAAAGCTSGEAPAAGQSNSGQSSPGQSTPENNGGGNSNLAKDIANRFDEVNRLAGRTITCMMIDEGSQVAPSKSNYLGNIHERIVGVDGIQGTADDGAQPVEMFVRTDPDTGRLYFWSATETEEGIIVYTHNGVEVPTDEPVFDSQVVNLDHVLTALNDDSLRGIHGEEQSQADDSVKLFSPWPEILLHQEHNGPAVRDATVEDVNRWTDETLAVLSYMAHESGADSCAPETIPLLPTVPGGTSDLPPELRV